MFNITSYTAHSEGAVIDCCWTYTTEDGSVSGKHLLATPAGSTPIVELTEEILVSWLVAQLTNTTEQFDAQIARDKKARDLAESLVTHTF